MGMYSELNHITMRVVNRNKDKVEWEKDKV